MATAPKRRIIRAGGQAALEIDESSVAMVANKSNFIVVDDRGITLRGPISIVADAMSIRNAGLFVGLSDFLNMIPSTIVSPIPKQIPFPPIFMMANIMKDVSFFMATLV